MHEFGRPLTTEQQELLRNTREEMTRKKPNGEYADKSLADLWTNRIKKASEAYKELQALYADYDGDIVSQNEHEATGETLDGEPAEAEALPDWQTFRDNFILDWMQNRIVVTTEEADEMFERDVNDALEQIESQGSDSQSTSEPTVASTASEPASTQGESTAEPAASAAPKRRGRPPGSGKAKSATKKVVKTKSVRKVVKAKSTGGRKGTSVASKAQTLIARYQEREWSRKDILQKLQDQLEIGKPYAATLYQKFAA